MEYENLNSCYFYYDHIGHYQNLYWNSDIKMSLYFYHHSIETLTIEEVIILSRMMKIQRLRKSRIIIIKVFRAMSKERVNCANYFVKFKILLSEINADLCFSRTHLMLRNRTMRRRKKKISFYLVETCKSVNQIERKKLTL